MREGMGQPFGEYAFAGELRPEIFEDVQNARPAHLSSRPALEGLAPIASATNDKQLNELAEAAKLKLDRESIEKLNEASAHKATA